MVTRDEVFVGATRHPKFDGCDGLYRLIIASLPFILLAVNNSWIFPEPTSIDRWVYAGFHLHLPEFVREFGGTYYGSRVPWTVAGWLVHSMFDDERALYVLHFGVYYLAAFSLYYALKNIFASSAAAFAGAMLLGTHSYFLSAIGWDYVDGSSIACLVASAAAMTGAAVRRHWRISAILWGVALSATISIYILMVLFVPVEIGMFLLLNRFAGKRSIVAVAALAVLGGAAGTFGFALINWLLGGNFLYFLGQVYVLADVAASRFGYDLPLAQWVWTSPWLLLPAITFVFSCLFVSLHHTSILEKLRSPVSTLDREISLYVCCLADIAALLIFVGLEVDHFYVLQIEYRANALLPFAFLTIGGAFAAMANPPFRVREIAFPIAVTAIALAPWVLATFAIALPGIGIVLPKPDLFENAPMLLIGWIAGGSLMLWLVVRTSYRKSGAASLIAFLSVVGLGAPSGLLAFPPNPAYKQTTLAVFDASREIGRHDPDARARFWFDAKGPDGDLFRDVVSTYLNAYSLVNAEFPRLIAANGRQSSVAPGERIILLASSGDPIGLANAAVAGQNLRFEQVATIAIRRPGVAFTIFVTDVTANVEQPGK